MKKNILEGLEPRRFFSLDPNGTTTVEPNLTLGRGSADYQVGGRWSSTASGSVGPNGSPVTLTWGFVNDGLNIPNGGVSGEVAAPSILQARLTSIYGSMVNAQAVFQQVFDRWSALTGITYVYQPTDDGAAFPNSGGVLGVRADIRISGHRLDGGSNVLAYNYFPNTGDMVIDTDDLISGGYMFSTSNNSRRLRNVLAHENGHGIGLSHVDPVNQTKLMEPFVSTLFDGPQFDDILASQSNYGDVLEKSGRNETAATATNLGVLATGNNQTLAQQVSISNTTDTDYFKFTVDAGSSVTFNLQPDGTTYLQGPQNGATSSFNAGAAGNLNMAFYDTNGTTVLQVANTSAAGAAETLTASGLAAGTYFVRVTMSSGSAQMYKLLANVVSGAAAPTTPDLASASDLGLSSTDDITSDNTPTLTGSATPNSQVLIFDGSDQIGTTNASVSGAWTLTLSTLSDGLHAITAKSTDGITLSPASGTLSLTIDTVAPMILSATYDREVTQRVALLLSDAIATQITVSDLSLVNTTTATNLGVIGVSYSGGNTSVTVALSSTYLLNGRYALSMPTTAATDVAGNPLAAALDLQFVQLAGDANDDGTVSFDDLLIVTQNFNQSGRTFSQGNFNYDSSGVVDFSDLLLLAQNYGTTLFQSANVIGTTVAAKRRANNNDVLA